MTTHPRNLRNPRNPRNLLGTWLVTALLGSSAAVSQAPPTGLTVADHPWDNGTRLDLTWQLSPDEGSLREYRIYQATVAKMEFALVATVMPAIDRATITDLTINSARLSDEAGAFMQITIDGTQSAQTAAVYLSTAANLVNGNSGSITFEFTGR